MHNICMNKLARSCFSLPFQYRLQDFPSGLWLIQIHCALLCLLEKDFLNENEHCNCKDIFAATSSILPIIALLSKLTSPTAGSIFTGSLTVYYQLVWLFQLWKRRIDLIIFVSRVLCVLTDGFKWVIGERWKYCDLSFISPKKPLQEGKTMSFMILPIIPKECCFGTCTSNLASLVCGLGVITYLRPPQVFMTTIQSGCSSTAPW